MQIILNFAVLDRKRAIFYKSAGKNEINATTGIIMPSKLVLASTSPRRIELLKAIGLDFEIVPSGITEESLEGETPKDHVLRLSEKKVKAITKLHPDAWVIGADTIVVVHSKILGKPKTQDEAKEMLVKLSGKCHQVFTGFTIAKRNGNFLVKDVVESFVSFKIISDKEMDWYVNSEEPYDKAGGYAVQGMGAFFIKEIYGSYTNVIGLPLCEVITALENLGAINFLEEATCIQQ
jgi:septum formation protein